MCVWGRDQGINTCVCGGGTKELIHVCVGDQFYMCVWGRDKGINTCVGEGSRNVCSGDQGITMCVCGGGTKELIHVCR